MRYIVGNEYTSISVFTRLVGTYSILVTTALFFNRVDLTSLAFDSEAILNNGEWWRCFTNLCYFGNPYISGQLVRQLIVMSSFLRHLYFMENYFYVHRKTFFICTIFFFIICSNVFALFMNEVGFFGDCLRMSIMTAWSQFYYHDEISVIGGLDISRFKATKLPIVWLAFLSFIDYPITISPVSPLPHMIFGIVLGYLYSTLCFMFGMVPEDLTRRRKPIPYELIGPKEFFIYFIMSIVLGKMF